MRRRVTPAALLPLLFACGGEGTDTGPAPETTWSLSDAPVASIGGTDERPDYLIASLTTATALSDGTIVVADGGARELRFYSPTGDFLRAAGGAGDGPGEFALIADMLALEGDTLLVLDRRGSVRFTAEGEYAGSRTFAIWDMGRRECRIAEGSWTLIPGGRVLTTADENPSGGECGPVPEPLSRRDALVGWTDPATGEFDSLVVLPSTERNSPNYRAYGKMLSTSFGGGRLFAGDTGGDSIHVFDLDTGQRLPSLPTPFEARPIPPEARTEEVRRFERDGVVEVGNAYAYPETYPRFARVLGDSEGNAWVMRFPDATRPGSSWVYMRASTGRLPDSGALWRVVGPDGTVKAELRTPPGFFAIEIGADYVLGVHRDELGREAVQVYGLSR